MPDSSISPSALTRLVAIRYVIAVACFFVVFFLPAGTFNYWQAWVYLALLMGPMLFVLIYLLKKHPDLLIRRMKFNEKEKQQKKIVTFAMVLIVLIFLVPGFDRRFGLSVMPPWISILGVILAVTGYVLIFFVFRENRFAGRTVEVEEEQPVISSGPYALVRHPMYLGSLMIYLFSPLALGSYWALIPALFTIPVFVTRLLDEEKVLLRDLKGYTDYQHKVRWHLIPGVW